MDLDDHIYKRVAQLSEQGNEYIDQENWNKAVDVFAEAFELLPNPKNEWEAATWLNASIGDALYMKGDFPQAKDYLFDALNCPDGLENPYVLLRLGETLFELGDKENSKEYLLRAYMLEGKEIFQNEKQQYYTFLKKHFDVD